MSWVLTVLGICALVVLHELGHFAVAKAVGMRVERFGLFFGPRLLKVRRGETEYGIGTIPLGGYVKIAGMNPREPVEPGEEHRGYYRQPVWKRVAVIAAGPAMNVLVAFLILWGVYTFAAEHALSGRARVAAVEPGMPAATALRPGDQILAVEGRPVRLDGERFNFTEVITAHRCPGAQTAGCEAATPVRVTAQRGGRRFTVSLRPRYDAREGRALIGIRPDLVYRREPVGAAAVSSISQMWNVTSTTASRIVRVFTSPKARREVHGIVGASDITSQAFSFGVPQAMYVLALISLSLAIFNLFPFLPLDGGHLFWALAEKVRGRAIPFAVMERASAVGIALVLLVAVIGLSNDINGISNGSLTLHR